mmetsp:Transcript_27737/g.64459  ORF Transcript_27737/g.64459 Transcript_27737/m.64459 type:complete len:453 (+) Transcript_27737:52-1410(+)
MPPSPKPPTAAERPHTPGGQPRISEIDEEKDETTGPAEGEGPNIPELKPPSCGTRVLDFGNRLEARLDRLRCIPGIKPLPCLRQGGRPFRWFEANRACFFIGRRGFAVFGNFRRLLLLISLVLSVLGSLLRALPAAALSTDRGTLHQWPWAHGQYTCLQSEMCADLEADVFIGLEALLVDSAKYQIYKAIPWAGDNCTADLSSLGAGSYCSICRDASRGCAAMAFLSIACSLFNIWTDVQRMRARNDHNCMKALAIVSNLLGAMQLMLAVSIFQLMCVAEFPLEDTDQTYRIALNMGKGGALIASACCINVFNVVIHWCIPVPIARWQRGVEPWKDPAMGLWPALEAVVEDEEDDFVGPLPKAKGNERPAVKMDGWMGDGDEDPVNVLVRAGLPRPETPDIWPDLHGDEGPNEEIPEGTGPGAGQGSGPGTKVLGPKGPDQGGNRRPSIESV